VTFESVLYKELVKQIVTIACRHYVINQIMSKGYIIAQLRRSPNTFYHFQPQSNVPSPSLPDKRSIFIVLKLEDTVLDLWTLITIRNV